MLRIPHYQLSRLDRQSCNINNPNRPKAGGGLCIHVQDDITVDAISLDHLNISDRNIELQCIKLTPRNQKQYTIFNLYRPTNGNVSEFLSNVDDKLTEYIGLENNEIFVMGDFNLNYLCKFLKIQYGGSWYPNLSINQLGTLHSTHLPY